MYGTWRGFRTAKVPAFKVRMNNVANQVGRYGTWAGNSMGIMTMQWAIIDSMYSYIRGETDYYNHVGAAFTSGYLFKVTAGQRPAIVTGALLASAVSAFGLIDTFVLSERIVGVPTPAVPSLNTN